jgi:hypothetical protein
MKIFCIALPLWGKLALPPWRNCQPHNLKVVGSNPTPATK